MFCTVSMAAYRNRLQESKYFHEDNLTSLVFLCLFLFISWLWARFEIFLSTYLASFFHHGSCKIYSNFCTTMFSDDPKISNCKKYGIRFCAAPGYGGTLQAGFLLTNRIVGWQYPDWQDLQRKEEFCLSTDIFYWLHSMYNRVFQEENHQVSHPASFGKRLATTLTFLANSKSFSV